jgi:hypothetical protein
VAPFRLAVTGSCGHPSRRHPFRIVPPSRGDHTLAMRRAETCRKRLHDP